MTERPAKILLSFSGTLTLRRADAVCASLCEALGAGAPVEIDCSEADEVDATFIQLLIAARRSAAARGTPFRLSAPAGGAVLETLVRGGFFDPSREDATPEAAFWTGRDFPI